jgi:hypothetical protein
VIALSHRIGWTMFKKRPLLAMPRILENKYYVDEIYDAALIRPIVAGSREGLLEDHSTSASSTACSMASDRPSRTRGRPRYLQAGLSAVTPRSFSRRADSDWTFRLPGFSEVD